MKSVHQLILLSSLVILIIVGGCSDNRKIDYQLQEQCGKQCKEWFIREYDGTGYSYVNHYNKKLNRCFIFVFGYSGDVLNEVIFDINDNTKIGGVSVFPNGGVFCSVLDKVCKSRGEWKKLIKHYMEE